MITYQMKKVRIYLMLKWFLKMATSWAYTPYDCFGYRRDKLALIDEGIVTNYITGVLNLLADSTTSNNCDRQEFISDNFQNRMSCLHLEINSCEEKNLIKDISEIMRIFDGNKVAFFIGGNTGEFDFLNNRLTVKPEIIVLIDSNIISFYKIGFITIDPKLLIRNIDYGIGQYMEQYGFCYKNGQYVTVSSLLNQFV